jgi:hypothetical protein
VLVTALRDWDIEAEIVAWTARSFACSAAPSSSFEAPLGLHRPPARVPGLGTRVEQSTALVNPSPALERNGHNGPPARFGQHGQVHHRDTTSEQLNVAIAAVAEVPAHLDCAGSILSTPLAV